jgi:hypothetical protein
MPKSAQLPGSANNTSADDAIGQTTAVIGHQRESFVLDEMPELAEEAIGAR